MNYPALLAGMGAGALVGLPIGWITAKIIAWHYARRDRARPLGDIERLDPLRLTELPPVKITAEAIKDQVPFLDELNAATARYAEQIISGRCRCGHLEGEHTAWPGNCTVCGRGCLYYGQLEDGLLNATKAADYANPDRICHYCFQPRSTCRGEHGHIEHFASRRGDGPW